MMVVADGGMDIPALPWCSVLEAVLWIEFRQIPVAWDLEGAIPGRIGTFGFAESGKSLADPRNYSTSFNRLFIEAREGSLPIRGNPGIEFERSNIGDDAGKFVHTACGETEIISPSRLKDCGFINFWSMEDRGWLSNVVYPSKLGPPNWVYSLVQVDFRCLAMRFPPWDGRTVRIGGGIILTEPTLQHAEWAAHAEPSGRVNLYVKDSALAPAGAQVAPVAHFLDSGEPPNASSQRAVPPTQPAEKGEQAKRRAKSTTPRPDAIPNGTPSSSAASDPDRGRPKRHLRTPQAAEYLSLSKSTLEKYRLTGEGPVYRKAGRICLYDIENLDAWLKVRERRSTSEPTS